MNDVPAVSVSALEKVFPTPSGGSVQVLRGVSLSIADNEFFTLLGPSGCGKTTLLRLIAGFEQPTKGSVVLFGAPMEGLPPEKRPVNTVFQSYMLFPHMTIKENVGFGLRMLGWEESAIRERVGQVLSLVRLTGLDERTPGQLSGGQQQRVALARALAPAPRVLLLDEPLSALDLKLRQGMRYELKKLQRETGITFIFVTHDQDEALTISDRIAVLADGQVQQVGGPEDVYENPVNRFVADFVGESNFVPASVELNDGARITCRIGNGAAVDIIGQHEFGPSDEVTISVRPEKVLLAREHAADGSALGGNVKNCFYGGQHSSYLVALDSGLDLMVRELNDEEGHSKYREGERVFLSLPRNAVRVLSS